MNEPQQLSEEMRDPGWLTLPSLAMARFASQPPLILTTLLLIDIGQSFGRSVGVIAQIQTVNLIVGAITALLMGILSIRFHHKSLLLVGLIFLCISAVGCFLAFDFITLNLAYSVGGIGAAMIAPMVFSLVGGHLPLEKRASAIGWVSAVMAIAWVIGPPAISFIASLESEGWRLAFIVFVLPISILSLVIAAKEVPSPTQSPHPPKKTVQHMEGFTEVFTSRSAVACLVGAALFLAASESVFVYGASFYREQFQVTTEFASITIIVSSLVYMLGTSVIGRFVNRLGRQPLTVLTTAIASIFFIAFVNVDNLWLSLVFMSLGSLFLGMWVTTSTSLTMEQVPKFRGTLMSIHTAAWYLGMALGTGVGGLALLLFDYGILGVSLGAIGLAAVFIFYLLTIDPTSTEVMGKEEQ